MATSSTPTTLELLSEILELEFGTAYLQHYGLFEDSDEGLLKGQQRFEKWLVGLIETSSPSGVVLFVGDSLLGLAKSLADEGRTVHWIGSQNLLDERIETPDSFYYAGDDFVASISPATVDVLVLSGSIRYLDQMAMLSKCRDLLGETGQLILFSEFLQDDSRIEYSALPNLSSFKQLSKRLGFEIVENHDVSNSAERTLDLVQPLLEKHGTALLEKAAISAEQLKALHADLATMRSEFSTLRREFYLFVLQRDLDADSEWVDVEYGDIGSFAACEISDLFEKSFNVDFNKELWDWKYVQGDGKCVVARLNKQDEIIAHYGGAPRKIEYFGKSSMAIQPCDVMVHPSMRKQYGKGSIFFEVAATFLEREIGNTVKHLLGFGFPNQKTMNISKRLGLYEKTDDFIEVVYPSSQTGSDNGQASIVDYDPNRIADSAELNALWAAMKEDYKDGIIGVRDADYIQHRYVNHPFSQAQLYRCVILREGEDAVAFAVLKEHEGGKLLMDLVCPVAAMKRAISIIKQELSSLADGQVLRLWLTSSGKDKVWTSDAIVNELGIEIPCNSWNPGPDAEILSGAWWLTAGDMDFV